MVRAVENALFHKLGRKRSNLLVHANVTTNQEVLMKKTLMVTLLLGFFAMPSVVYADYK